jgi:hypothetical protein
MLNICALAPAFILGRLNKVDAFEKGAKVLLVTTEGGSITLRTSEEGGGSYGHHASKVSAESPELWMGADDGCWSDRLQVIWSASC